MSEQEAIFLMLRYFREHGQGDPTDRHHLLADEQLRAILGQRRVHRKRLLETLLINHLESMNDDEHKTAWAIPRVAKLLGIEPASGEEAVRELYAYAEGRGLLDPKQRCYVLSDMKAAGFATEVDMHQWVRITPEIFGE